MPIDYKEYPPNWKREIVPAIRQRSGDRCEGSPKYPRCRAANKQPHPDTGSIVVLTTAHMDRDVKNNFYDLLDANAPGNNLRHLCQRCHLGHDRSQHVHSRKYGRASKKEQQIKIFK